jgi:hypothetical protein
MARPVHVIRVEYTKYGRYWREEVYVYSNLAEAQKDYDAFEAQIGKKMREKGVRTASLALYDNLPLYGREHRRRD